MAAHLTFENCAVILTDCARCIQLLTHWGWVRIYGPKSVYIKELHHPITVFNKRVIYDCYMYGNQTSNLPMHLLFQSHLSQLLIVQVEFKQFIWKKMHSKIYQSADACPFMYVSVYSVAILLTLKSSPGHSRAIVLHVRTPKTLTQTV